MPSSERGTWGVQRTAKRSVGLEQGVISFCFLMEVELIYMFVLVSGVQQSDPDIYIYLYILFQILFHYRLLQD